MCGYCSHSKGHRQQQSGKLRATRLQPLRPVGGGATRSSFDAWLKFPCPVALQRIDRCRQCAFVGPPAWRGFSKVVLFVSPRTVSRQSSFTFHLTQHRLRLGKCSTVPHVRSV
eukprot:scaffold245856_cov31-Tisochrysis_lutea.AAC.1